MASVRLANTEPLPGYRLLEPLGRGGFGEVWKCEAPGGLLKAIKFVRGRTDDLNFTSDSVAQEYRALQRIKAIRHPFLLSMERVEVVEGDLIIVMELADCSLHDLFHEHRRAGRPGIPRAELLSYLREAAEVLDLMNLEHGLQHLDIKPRNLFLVGRHIKVADFGMVSSLGGKGGEVESGAITPLYAAPETFLETISLFSDQYSLAITYHELLTGTFPFRGTSFMQLVLEHTSAEPDLSRLAEADQTILRRALAKEPTQRFPSCTALIGALEAVPGSLPARSKILSAFDIDLGNLAITPRSSSLHVEEGSQTATLGGSGSITRGGEASSSELMRTGGSGGLLPGYTFLECQGRAPGAEVWRALGPNGRSCQIRLVRHSVQEHQGPDPLRRLTALRHRTLAGIEVLPAGADRFALVSNVGESHLGSRFKTCQAQGLPGIPRQELLGYLLEVAEALDDLYQTSDLFHLTLSPRQVYLKDEGVQLVDFGLAQLFWIPAGVQPAALNTRYAALELFESGPSETSDQYSLALIYQELLVGLHPFRNLNLRQMASRRMRGLPDLALLPAQDRPIIAQALGEDPGQRFPSNTDFVRALLEVGSAAETATFLSMEPTQTVLVTAPTRVVPTLPSTVSLSQRHLPSWRPALEELVGGLARQHEIRTRGSLFYLYNSRGPTYWVEHRCLARLVPGTTQLKLEAFRQHWRGDEVVRTANLAIYRLRTKGTLWQRCLGRVPGLEVVIQFRSAREGGQIPLLVRIQAVHCGVGKAKQLLEEVAPEVLLSLQTYLLTTCEARDQEYYPFAQHVLLWPANEGRTARSVEAAVRDIGRQGMTVYLSGILSHERITVELPCWASKSTFRVAGQVRTRQAVGNGQQEVEIDFEDSGAD